MIDRFDPEELEFLNNFHMWIVPGAEPPKPGPPQMSSWLDLSKTHRERFPDAWGYSDRYLDATGEEILRDIAATATEVYGSFEALQLLYCNWRNHELDFANSARSFEERSALEVAWKDALRKMYAALRNKGYTQKELLL